MPHVFVNRPRLFRKLSSSSLMMITDLPVPIDVLMEQYFWETINAIVYIVGGLLLIIGSVLFLPQFEKYQYIGSHIFIIASMLYLIVSSHDWIEIYMNSNHHHGKYTILSADSIAAICYSIGALTFIFGSIFYLPTIEFYQIGAWNFIVGSFLFVVGAVINSIQIFDSPTRLTAFYANLVAVFYVTGSALYLSASVPYTFHLDTKSDYDIVNQFVAILYIFGSVLFTIAGMFNLYRAKLIVTIEKNKHDTQEQQQESQNELVSSTTPYSKMNGDTNDASTRSEGGLKIS